MYAYLTAWLLLPLLALAGVGFAAAGVWSQRAFPISAIGEAAGVALATVVLVLYVAREDSYRDGGTSRWDAYGAQGLTAAAVSVGVAAVIFLVLGAALRRRGWPLAAVGILVATAAAVLEFLAIFANSLN